MHEGPLASLMLISAFVLELGCHFRADKMNQRVASLSPVWPGRDLASDIVSAAVTG